MTLRRRRTLLFFLPGLLCLTGRTPTAQAQATPRDQLVTTPDGRHWRVVPQQRWRVEASLIRGARRHDFRQEEYELRLQRDPGAAFSFTVAPEDIHLEVDDAEGRPRATQARLVCLPTAPEPPIRYPAEEGPDYLTRALGVRLDLGRLSPGLYTFRVIARVKATKDADGSPLPLPDAAADIHLYVPPPPDRLPALRPGQSFLCLPGDETTLPYRDASGRPVSRAVLALKTLTLEHAEPLRGKVVRLTFLVEGRREPIFCDSEAGANGLPGLKPLVEDDVLRRLRSGYEGRRVWGYGGIGATYVSADPGFSGGFSADALKPVRIKRLVRVYDAGYLLPIGPQINALGGDRESEFGTSDPLIAVLDIPDRVNITGSSFGGRGTREAVTEALRSSRSARLGYFDIFADAWDFERTFSLAPPAKAHPEWSRALQRAVAAGHIQRGMTPEMAAWAMGYPSEYGTAAALLHKATATSGAWRYDNLPPFNYWVYFKNGKVDHFGPDGGLP